MCPVKFFQKPRTSIHSHSFGGAKLPIDAQNTQLTTFSYETQLISESQHLPITLSSFMPRPIPRSLARLALKMGREVGRMLRPTAITCCSRATNSVQTKTPAYLSEQFLRKEHQETGGTFSMTFKGGITGLYSNPYF